MYICICHNFHLYPTVKEFSKLVYMCRSSNQKSSTLFFRNSVQRSMLSITFVSCTRLQRPEFRVRLQQEQKSTFIFRERTVIIKSLQEMLLWTCIPMAPKKSFPRNGNPGRFARTIMRKSGCATTTESECCQCDAAKATHTNTQYLNKYAQGMTTSIDKHHMTT